MKFQETEKTELKRILNDGFEKALVAFLNSFDGVIYIGVEDDGTVVGVKDLDDELKRIADIVTSQILPAPQDLVEIGSLYVDGKNVVCVRVKKGDKLYYIKKYGRSAQGCFIRVGTSSRSMTEEQIEKGMLGSLPQQSLVDKPVLRKDFSFLFLKTYLTERGIHVDDESLKRNFNLVTADGRYNMLAELLADNNYISIKVAVFQGKDKSVFLKRNEYGNTCLIHALKQVISYCEAINDTYVDVSVRPRMERKKFSGEAFEEAWVNACVHNKWIEGIPPAVYIFEDRLEIVSYGGIPKGLTKEDFLAGKTAPVNKELMNIFLQCGVVEQSGHGVPVVVREYGAEAYEFSGDMITVKIPFYKSGMPAEIGEINSESGTINSEGGTINPKSGEINSETGEINPESGEINPESGEINPESGEINSESGEINSESDSINLATELAEKEKVIYSLIKSDVYIHRTDIIKTSGYSKNTVDKIIKSLKSKGYIKGRSSNKGGYWIL